MTTLIAKTTEKQGANRENFYKASKAVFNSCARPKRKPDFISESGSEYWFTKNGVIRYADHWLNVASCFWVLDDFATMDIWKETAAFAKWEDFQRTVVVFEKEEVVKLYKNGNCITKTGKRVVYRAA